jgi:hypothetical protein
MLQGLNFFSTDAVDNYVSKPLQSLAIALTISGHNNLIKKHTNNTSFKSISYMLARESSAKTPIFSGFFPALSICA